jgi:hypothetical protein
MADKKENKTKIILSVIGALATIAAAMVGSPVLVEMYKTSLTQTQTQTPTMTPVSTIELPTKPSASPSNSQTATSVWTPSAEYPGSDWKRGCISAEIWQLYSSDPTFRAETKDGCYQLLEHGISAHQGNLAFVRNKVRQTEAYGILIPIPDNVAIEFSLRVNALNNAEVWTGIVKSPDSRAGSYLVAKKNAYFDIVEIHNEYPSKRNENYHVRYNQDYYHFKFEIEGNLWNIWRNGTPQTMFSDINLMFTPRYLFIGYRAYPSDGVSGTIDVRISDLTIEEK